jgi:hypothetical protein
MADQPELAGMPENSHIAKKKEMQRLKGAIPGGIFRFVYGAIRP